MREVTFKLPQEVYPGYHGWPREESETPFDTGRLAIAGFTNDEDPSAWPKPLVTLDGEGSLPTREELGDEYLYFYTVYSDRSGTGRGGLLSEYWQAGVRRDLRTGELRDHLPGVPWGPYCRAYLFESEVPYAQEAFRDAVQATFPKYAKLGHVYEV